MLVGPVPRREPPRDAAPGEQAMKKLYRVADNALVVYHGKRIVGVKHRDVGPWLVWNDLRHRWDKAVPDRNKEFEKLPLVGSRPD
jgi:hypothetical protein